MKRIFQKMLNREQNKPVAIQCLWCSDWEYIGLGVELVFKSNNNYTTQKITELEYSNFDSMEKMVKEAKKIALEYVYKYDIEFYFPSPDEWSRDCPNWWESELSPKCEDCKIPIIPSDSEYLPKEICYPCHLKRERNEQIVNDEPYNEGVTMYLSKNDEKENIGYCSEFKGFTIASFIKNKVEKQLSNKVVDRVILDKTDIFELEEDLKRTLNQKLENYIKPDIDEQMKRFVKTYKIEYEGKQYELASKFNNEHDEISNLIWSLKINQKALTENYTYEIYFKNGITHRDDNVLRFINYVNKGSTDINNIKEYYKNLLTEDDVLQTIEKLQRIGCVDIMEKEVTITKLGQGIV